MVQERGWNRIDVRTTVSSNNTHTHRESQVFFFLSPCVPWPCFILFIFCIPRPSHNHFFLAIEAMKRAAGLHISVARASEMRVNERGLIFIYCNW